MKGKLRLLLLTTIPVFVFVNVYQTYTYQGIERQVSSLESQEQSWIEANKRITAGIAVLSAPQRIAEIAVNELGMKRHDDAPRLDLRVRAAKVGNDG